MPAARAGSGPVPTQKPLVPEDTVILAAGRGTRMKNLTEAIPKPMLPVAGRPLLEYILEALRAAGLRRAVVITGYQAEQVERHFGDGSRLGMSIRYRCQVVQDGTARALLLAREEIGERPFLLAWGDILTERSNYPELLRQFVDSGADALLAVNWVDDPSRGAAVTVTADDRIERIVEKPPPGTANTHWHNAGIGVFRPIVFDYLAAVRASPRGEYEIPDALSAMIGDGLAVRAFRLRGFWADVGTPEDLARVENLFLNPGAGS